MLCTCTKHKENFKNSPQHTLINAFLFIAGHKLKTGSCNHHINGLVQDCINSSANALELLQSGNKPLIWPLDQCLKLLHSEYIPHEIKNNYKYENNPSRTTNVTECTQNDVQYFGSACHMSLDTKHPSC